MIDKIGLLGIQTAPGTKGELPYRAFQLLDEALSAYRKTDLVVMPECYSYYPSLKDKDEIEEYNYEILTALSDRAIMYNTYIVGGSVIHRRENGKLYNTAVVVDRDGNIIGEYDKCHLFDVLDGSGNKESDLVCAGQKGLVFDADFGKVGVCICYDIRFPELIREYAKEGAEYLAVPAAFFSPRADHWQALLRAAALENGMYVIGANLFGADVNGNVFCGRSSIFDPWGVQLSGASDREEFVQAYVDKDYASSVRNRLGILTD